ncbi:hypothetical protein SAMN05428953_11488 [Mesorhizobium muleiense]|uniref:Uncharacterized protein n=1 Tax=Mesorhizobium muleiense TaxID=1004279 RepID=A0A1G9B6H8_9HYPH|nr:hypothetical protein SAMN05428953_11488 [Mesorhizobium muleiense]
MVGPSIAGAEVEQWRTSLWKQPYRITWPTAYNTIVLSSQSQPVG